MSRGSLRVVVATRNRGKVVELLRLWPDVPRLELCTLAEVAAVPEVVEDGATFEANAIKKARQTAAVLGLPVLADDSGLEVDALDGAPGVWSARFAREGATDRENNDELLRRLAGTPDDRRGARYRCVLAFADPEGALGAEVATAEGSCEGRIIRVPRGEGGFGYDPLFVPVGEQRTMAELSADEKDAISHRARAARALSPLLERYFGH
jgi:XTP/dITP diphosphohydrolase